MDGTEQRHNWVMGRLQRDIAVRDKIALVGLVAFFTIAVGVMCFGVVKVMLHTDAATAPVTTEKAPRLVAPPKVVEIVRDTLEDIAASAYAAGYDAGYAAAYEEQQPVMEVPELQVHAERGL